MPISSRASISPNGETNPESTRYLTFLKGRVGRKVADFFMDFLGASEGLNAKAQNRGLLQAVDDFAADAQLDKSERQNVRQQVYAYCNEQLQAGEEIELESLSKELAGVSEKSFQNSPLSRAMSWKRASRRIAAPYVS